MGTCALLINVSKGKVGKYGQTNKYLLLSNTVHSDNGDLETQDKHR